MARRPLLLVSDGPTESTGLARIARDLAGVCWNAAQDEIDLVQVGGPALPVWPGPWRHVPLSEADRGEDWGAAYVAAVYRSLWGETPGILWTIWDAARLAAYRGIDLPIERWAYLPVDAQTLTGGYTGPAAAVVREWDRVIAYGRWGSQVLRATGRARVPYLPHGLPTVASWDVAAIEWEAFPTMLGRYYRPTQRVIGTVATNQPRKDWGLVAQTLRTLLDRGEAVFGWWHVDVLHKAWSLPALVEDLGLQRFVMITGWTGAPWSDAELRRAYAHCAATIAPGLGEGFGYPIVESLAAGTPVVHGDYGGGVELVPKREWRFPVRELRTETIHNLRRPVYRPDDVANALQRVWAWQAQVGDEVARAYCRGSVAHLDWEALEGRWASWIRAGLRGGEGR